ncbi:FGGY-family carbohydrate kinase [Alkalitalea saponilacus]|uniref:Sugar (Pentulose or hexulose) kinase n=1 Tax=Alkalitalea saponilacus TaxID=889453 RepID=A0A1T5EUA1_9BACT|nr:FGGY family carbohydrate kinase [Alkalitalea saponilacus]ASB48029.1 carbohydrate kinase [Alkalitalea saponilacus]SKB87523.1 Sugar (pentulose or hexulose) kinase [Alkalitalea saponilacus]
MLKVIAVFDIGKTNKKLLLFDQNLDVVHQLEEPFSTITDEDGEECDDIERIEKWLFSSVESLIMEGKYQICGINFSTYGASLCWLDEKGSRLTQVYNYLKQVSTKFQNELFSAFGGEEEFCRRTASPALGMLLNSGVQMLWMKSEQPEVFNKSKYILHFPQYLSSLFTKRFVSEHTSIGCHTFLWDFDHNEYHHWLSNEGISLPEPISNDKIYTVKINDQEIACGIGIHDSSSSLVPYFKGSKEPFLLISTGTWCINMNPFNHSPLTLDELRHDCLCYMSIQQNPVKSSRFFMGHIHDVNVERITKHFNVLADAYKKVEIDEVLLSHYIVNETSEVKFFVEGVPADYIDKSIDLNQFKSFSEAYHRFMYDLTIKAYKSILLISESGSSANSVFVSGGFARNEIFVRLLAEFMPEKKVFTTQVDNSSALGAALVIYHKVFKGAVPEVSLGLVEWNGVSVLKD